MKTGLIKALGVLGIIVVLALSLSVSSYAALSYQQVSVSPTGTNKVLVLVNSAIFDAIYATSLKQYVADLEAEGYNVTLTRFVSGTAVELKSYLKTIYSLKGVVLVGNLPIASYEIPASSGKSYSNFPCDMFYMDLKGQWIDADGNGIYEKNIPVSGSAIAAIWVSRLTASPVVRTDMNEVAMLKNYFVKNHNYRLGKLVSNRNALEYLDINRSFDYRTNLAYPNRLRIANTTVSATDYRKRIVENFEWVHLEVPSSPVAHQFTNSTIFNYSQIPLIEPKVLFYFLGGGNSCLFFGSNYIGGHYIFAKQSGLLALGSTKYWDDSCAKDLYGLIKAANIGEAFKKWLNIGDYSIMATQQNMFGMTVLGDATLTLDPPIATISSINPSTVEKGKAVIFTGSGSVPNASITGYSWRSSINSYLGGTATLTTSALSVGTHTIYFKVKDSKGRWSSEAQATLIVNPATLPKAPTNLSVYHPFNSGNLILYWNDNSNNENGFIVERKSDALGLGWLAIATLGPNITSYSDNNLIAYMPYEYRVKAFNSSGSSSYSNISSGIVSYWLEE